MSPLLFDLTLDPGCFTNIAGQPESAAIEREYAQRLLTWRMEAGERVLTGMRATKAGLVEERDPARWR
jgi:hypothetical protein